MSNSDPEINNITTIDIPSVKAFHISDDSLKELGELLTNESSRALILALGDEIEEEKYVNQMHNELNMRVSLVSHHLKKLGKLGLLEITEKPISKKTKNHRYFKIKTNVFLDFQNKENSEIRLKKIFKDIVKFACVGIAGMATWFGTSSSSSQRDISSDLTLPVLITITIIGFGLILIYCSNKRKKN